MSTSRSKTSCRYGPPEPNEKKPPLPVCIVSRSSESDTCSLPMNVMRRTVTGSCSAILNLTITSFSRCGSTVNSTSARK